MSFATVAVAAAVTAVGGVLYYGKRQADKASYAARAAVNQQKSDDANAQAKAEADAANEANALRVAQKRAYQANALALGGSGDDSLGAPGKPNSVLAAGASNATRAASVGGSTTVLGGGSPIVGSGGPGAGNYRTSRGTRSLA